MLCHFRKPPLSPDKGSQKRKTFEHGKHNHYAMDYMANAANSPKHNNFDNICVILCNICFILCHICIILCNIVSYIQRRTIIHLSDCIDKCLNSWVGQIKNCISRCVELICVQVQLQHLLSGSQVSPS